MASTLWIEERDKPLWHRAVARLASLEYRAACSLELSAREGGVWPQKLKDPGPAPEHRCQTCTPDSPPE